MVEPRTYQPYRIISTEAADLRLNRGRHSWSNQRMVEPIWCMVKPPGRSWLPPPRLLAIIPESPCPCRRPVHAPGLGLRCKVRSTIRGAVNLNIRVVGQPGENRQVRMEALSRRAHRDNPDSESRPGSQVMPAHIRVV
jgi:hypothetical protein